MSEIRQKRRPLLNVCTKCEQELPDPMDRISIALERLRKEFGFGEKCKSK